MVEGSAKQQLDYVHALTQYRMCGGLEPEKPIPPPSTDAVPLYQLVATPAVSVAGLDTGSDLADLAPAVMEIDLDACSVLLWIGATDGATLGMAAKTELDVAFSTIPFHA